MPSIGKKKILGPLLLFLLFEGVAVTLWLTKGDSFYLFNFSYIGLCLAVCVYLYGCRFPHARRIAQLCIGSYMLVYLGLICRENMQLEGFWYYLFQGSFTAATIHYAVAKIFGPLLFGRGWCGYACWTAMVLDLLPYKRPRGPRRKLGWIRYVCFALSLLFVGGCSFFRCRIRKRSWSGPLSWGTCSITGWGLPWPLP